MIERLLPYSDYRPANLRWLSKLPRGWKILRGKAIFSIVDRRSQDGAEERLTVSANHGIIPRRSTTVTMFEAKSYIGHKLCWPGDLVVNSLWAWAQGLGVSNHHGLISSAYSVYRPRIAFADYADYFDYLLRSAAYLWELRARSKGVWISRLQLSDQSFMDIPILLPPPEQQKLIVRFLDHATGKIDRAIRAKRRVIALLNEQKQAIIHRAVTRGLDEHVSLEESGISWLPKMPAGWRTSAIKRLLSKMDYGTSEPASEKGSIPVLTMGNIQRGEVTVPKAGGLLSVADELLLSRHDLLFTRTNGNPDLVGKVGIFRGNADERITFASYLVRLRARPEHNPEWLHLLLNSAEFWAYARSHALVNLQTNLNVTRYGQFLIPVPSRPVQDEIVGYVQKSTGPLDAITSALKSELSALAEYKTRIVADVVTGKLDVRPVAAALPTEDDGAACDDQLLSEEDDLMEEEAA